jgi:hypothetical protein
LFDKWIIDSAQYNADNRKSSALSISKGSLDRPNKKEGTHVWMGNKRFSKFEGVRITMWTVALHGNYLGCLLQEGLLFAKLLWYTVHLSSNDPLFLRAPIRDSFGSALFC